MGENLKIKNRLFIMFSFSAIIMFFLLLFFALYIGRFKEQYTEITHLRELSNSIAGLSDKQAKFINIEKNNDEYIETGNSFYIDEYIALSNQTINVIDSISRYINQGDRDYLLILNIKKNLEQNKTSFTELSLMVRNRGNAKTGIINSVEKSFEHFTKDIEKHNQWVFLIEKLQEINLHKNIYYNKPSTKTKENLQKIIKENENTIVAMMEDSLRGDKEMYRQLKTDFFVFSDNISRLFENDTEIGYLPNEKSYINQHNELLVSLNEKVSEFITGIEQDYQHKKERLMILIGIFSFLLLFLIFISFALIKKDILQPLANIHQYLSKLSYGNLPKKVEVNGRTEISDIEHSINDLRDNLDRTRYFSMEVGKGNFNNGVDVFNPESELGKALHEMREKLENVANDREKQVEVERTQAWINSGISSFNDILRQTTNGIEDLTYNVISKLTEYIGASQGAIFITNDEDPSDIYLELKAAYAYNRKKYINKKIRKGEELIGTCFMEKKLIYIDEVPENYLEIRSGLGKVSPDKLLIVPLMLEMNVLGIIEIASLKNIGHSQIDFVVKIAEAIASTIANMKMNLRTANLLEKTRLQAEELRTKEEQMRINMQELRATQEASAKKEAEASGFVSAVNHTIIRADYNLDGKLEYANTKFNEFIGLAFKDLVGSYVNSLIDISVRAEFDTEWQRVVNGGKHIEREIRFKTREGYRWLLATYTSIKNLQNKPTRILFLAININEQKSLNLNIQGELEAISSTVIKAEFSVEGLLLDYNETFRITLGFEDFELAKMNVLQFVPPSVREDFKKQWRVLITGESFEIEQNMLNNRNREKWFRGAYTPVKDFDNKVFKIVYIGYDITSQKLIEREAKERAEKLETQEYELRKNMSELIEIQDKLRYKDAEHLRKIDDLNIQNNAQLDQLIQKDVELRGQLEAISKTNLLAEYDLNENILQVNQIFCFIFEYTTEELIGKKHRILFDLSQTRTIEYREFWKKLNSGGVVEGESVRLTKSGNEIYTNGVYYPLKNKDGKIYKILELAFDITATKKRELEISAKLNAIDLSNAMSEYSPDGTIVSVNKIFCELYGYEAKKLLGYNHKMLVDDEHALSDKYKDMWANLKKGQIIEGEFKRLNNDGEEIFIKAVYNPIKNKAGVVVSVFELAFDITDNKELELDLKRRTQQMLAQEEMMKLNMEEMQATQEEMEKKDAERSSIISSINQATFAVEYKLNGEIINVSTVVEEKLNRKASEIIGKNHRDFVDFNEIDETEYKNWWNRLKNGEIVKRITKKIFDGKQYWFNDSFSPIFNSEGKVERIINIAFDVTQIKELEAELKQSNQEILVNQEKLKQNIAEMEKTQNDLSNKEYEMRSIVKSINKAALVVDIDLNGLIINMNQLALEQFGIMKSDIKNRKYTTLNKIENFDTILSNLLKGAVIERESQWKFENKSIWVHETFSAIFDKDRQPIRILNIAFDISESRKQQEILKIQTDELISSEEEMKQNLEEMKATQEEMSRKEAELRNQFEAINRTNIMVVISKDELISNVNQLFSELFGFEKDEIVGKHYRVLLPINERKSNVWKKRWATLLNGKFIDDEFMLINKIGEPIFIKGVFNPMLDDENSVDRILLLASDITKRKKQEAEIGSQMQALTLNYAMAYIDTNALFLSANALFCEMYSYVESDIVGMSLRILADDETKKSSDFVNLLKNIQHGISSAGEYKTINKDGKTVYIKATFNPITDSSGKVYKIMLLATDITNLKLK